MAVYSLNEHDHRWLWIVIVGHETGSDFWNQQVTCVLFIHTYIHTYLLTSLSRSHALCSSHQILLKCNHLLLISITVRNSGTFPVFTSNCSQFCCAFSVWIIATNDSTTKSVRAGKLLYYIYWLYLRENGELNFSRKRLRETERHSDTIWHEIVPF